MSDNEKKIYLHIGRNKAGSTTLQDFFLAYRETLREQGVQYALFGHLKDSCEGVLGLGLPHEVADYKHQNPDHSLLISNEFMFGWPDEYTRGMASALNGLSVAVLAYIRDYREWLCSSYSQEAKMGTSARDFDSYFEWMAGQISAWPALEGWGEEFGWTNMRIRSLDAASLSGANLIPDCLEAIGVDPGIGAAETGLRINQAPSWMLAENHRSMARPSNGIHWDEDEATAAGILNQVLSDCMDESPHGGMTVQYLTPEQDRYLADLYNCDLQKIMERTGIAIPPAQPRDLPERPFLPSVDHFPSDIRRAYDRKIASRAFRKEFPGSIKMLSADDQVRLRPSRYIFRILR